MHSKISLLSSLSPIVTKNRYPLVGAAQRKTADAQRLPYSVLCTSCLYLLRRRRLVADCSRLGVALRVRRSYRHVLWRWIYSDNLRPQPRQRLFDTSGHETRRDETRRDETEGSWIREASENAGFAACTYGPRFVSPTHPSARPPAVETAAHDG